MKEDKKKRDAAVGTPYDDVFRTLLNDCRSLILPMLNEMFDEHYTGDEQVVFSQNAHFLNRQDGEEDKRVTDSNFKVIGKMVKDYLCECQSTPDNSMLVRLFEYATQAALDKGELKGNRLKVTIPHTAVLFLRSNAATPNRMEIEIETPGGTVCYGVPVMKAARYGLDEIFQKGLLFLIPFYIFSHESHLREYDEDGEKLRELKAEYAEIVKRLDSLAEEGTVSAYIRMALLEMSGKVVNNIAAKYGNVREGVRSVMGGQILEYEAKTIFNQGVEQGEKRGMKQGEKIGEERINKLNAILMEGNRFEDLKRSVSDRDFQKELIGRYGV